jgi:ParB-like nuclease domain
MKKPKVHPVAELFPMMSDEELDDLAQDIKANGLLHPIVLDESGMLIDGRNRFEACRRAGIEPDCEMLNGQDPVAFIMSSNDKRRHMAAGQRAMVAAKVRLDNNYPTLRAIAKQAGVTHGYVNQASVVLQYRADLADDVMRGDLALKDAYEKAITSKKDAESDEGKMRRLRKQAPDLADQVTEEKLTLAEAVGALEARLNEERARERIAEEQRQLSTQHLETIVKLAQPHALSPQEKAERYLDLYDRKYSDIEITAELLTSCTEVLKILTKKWNQAYGQNPKKPSGD